MATLRSPKKQAEYAVKKILAIGQPRPKINDWRVHSLGTARTYIEALTLVASFMMKFRLGALADLTPAIAITYLEMRSQEVGGKKLDKIRPMQVGQKQLGKIRPRQVGQKQLDKIRQAMQAILAQKLPVIKSELDQALSSRAYTLQQIEMVSQAQSRKFSLPTLIAEDGGLRAHELLTLLPVAERAADKRTVEDGGRCWSENRFRGRDQIKIYTVVGKGGLIREVALSQKLADELEHRRLTVPVKVKDRKIFYDQHYDIGGGKQWSDSFTKASERSLGWSTGGHGTRHTFAQKRMKELQQLGYTYREALEIVSQEMGHFRPDITEVYLL